MKTLYLLIAMTIGLCVSAQGAILQPGASYTYTFSSLRLTEFFPQTSPGMGMFWFGVDSVAPPGWSFAPLRNV